MRPIKKDHKGLYFSIPFTHGKQSHITEPGDKKTGKIKSLYSRNTEKMEKVEEVRDQK